jgi:RNA polymerase sigma factor (sigma-70 family)
MEVSALKAPGVPALNGRSPLLRLAPDERLIALIRRGNQGAFEALVSRYQSRLLAFCRHMLGSKEDAEDVLQEVFAAAYNAINADERPINVRPWLYRIARNRSLNHLRRVQAIGVDSMDIHLAEHGASTADKVHQREEFRLLIADVQTLAETQRTALLLREIDALSYDQIAEAMETTIPSVKSLLVRARVGLAEAAEARGLSCDDVRLELAEVAEGLTKVSPPVRRHLKSCERCSAFQSQLKANNKALAMVFPVGAFFLVKKLLLTHLGTTAGAGGAGGAAAGGAAGGAAATAGGVAAGGAAAGSVAAGGAATGMLSAGVATVASKTAAGLAAAAIVTAGAVEVRQVAVDQPASQAPAVIASAAPAVAPAKPTAAPAKAKRPATVTTTAKPAAVAPAARQTQAPTTTTPAPAPVVTAPAPVTTAPAPAPAPTPEPEVTETVTEVTTLPATTTPAPEAPVATTPPTGPTAPGELVPGPPTGTNPAPVPPVAPPAGEGGPPAVQAPPAP